MLAKMAETNDLASKLQQKLSDYAEINVQFTQQKTKQDQLTAFERLFAERTSKYESLQYDINLKMKQYLELAQKRKQTLTNQRGFSSGTHLSDPESQELSTELLDKNEKQLQGDIEFHEKIIAER